MTQLLIDAGNSAIKWCRSDAGAFGEVHVELHRGVADGLRERLVSAWNGLARPLEAHACSVAGAGVDAEIEAAASASGATMTWWRSQDRFDGPFILDSGYRDPLQLGADRWHAMLGACSRVAVPAGLLVVMAGTATTVDSVVRESNRFRFIGGCIAPGERLMIESLAARTAGLPAAQGRPVEFPDNTDDAIVSGVGDAQAGLVQRVAERLKNRCGSAPVVLLAGGHALRLAERLREGGLAPMIEDNLVLKGLAVRQAGRSR